MSMMMSPAWKALTARQKVLYLYCKAQIHAEKRKPKTFMEEEQQQDADRLNFTMNQSKWRGLYELYKPNDEKSFYRDMAALIDSGFIRRVQSGRTTRTKTIYGFSNGWRPPLRLPSRSP